MISKNELRKYVGNILILENNEERKQKLQEIPEEYRGFTELLVRMVFSQIYEMGREK